MKKLFAILCAIMLIGAFTASSAMSCDGPDCYGSGNFDGTAAAGSAAIDAGMKFIPHGAAGGIAGAAGGTKGFISGRVNDGEANASLNVVGGGLVNQTGYTFNVPASLSIGVGSSSHAEAVTSANLDLSTKADCSGWFDKNYGTAIGGFTGGAAQGTLDGSIVGSSPLPMWDSKGVTGGIAAQGSAGLIAGGAIANSETEWFFPGGACPDNAYANAGIDMVGNSYSESYRYIDFGCGTKTEGMGTNVGANTTVNSYGDSSRDGFTTGGFIAGGKVCATTVQSAPGLGGAVATVHGAYAGAGSLNCNYSGSVTGSTYTSVTTVDGYKGSIVSAGSSASVSSHTSTAGN